jgi:DNA-binding transcriptional ArsR family regulator
MVTIEFGVEDLANTRFGISPLAQTVHSLWGLTDPGQHTIHLPWLRSVRSRLSANDLKVLHALVGPSQIPHDFRGRPSRALPDFLTPRPARFTVAFDEELATVRTTPAEVVRHDLLATHAPQPVPDALRAAKRVDAQATRVLLNAICDVLDRYWQAAMAPVWPQLRLVLEADSTYRARQLVTGGARLLFADVHPNIHFRNGVLTITEMIGHRTMAAAGRGLLLMPSIFAIKPVPPQDPHQPPSLAYPSRGIGTLWAPPPQPERAALIDLFGRTRALLLEMLDEPLPTIEIARRLTVTPSAVSQHLQTLHKAGLLSRARDRRQVLYRRSPLGDHLVLGSPRPHP